MSSGAKPQEPPVPRAGVYQCPTHTDTPTSSKHQYCPVMTPTSTSTCPHHDTTATSASRVAMPATTISTCPVRHTQSVAEGSRHPPPPHPQRHAQ
ncbi:hypothetical protein E2C01_098790 [Portunus trituberculatus]|uniref:Uncharacterized protein n=1 Tax=Portunus trituberculatus TaxID=210409 RepID=A0A5B7KF13_PORTR|nr:hypothetical protein [Portunus trituberculatus]